MILVVTQRRIFLFLIYIFSTLSNYKKTKLFLESTPITEDGIVIKNLGFSVRQVKKVTQNKLSMFFVDLEQDEINKDILPSLQLLTKILRTPTKMCPM
jgi:ABC-type phosphate/phosphonate transport system substrate-binding protein